MDVEEIWQRFQMHMEYTDEGLRREISMKL
jgi:hypothetical protein